MSINVLSPQQTAALINDYDKVILGGFIGSVVPEAIEHALGQRFINSGHPRKLDLYFTAGQGDGQAGAVNHLAHEGMVNMAYGGHWGLVPPLQKLAMDDKISGYNLPQGVICQLFRDSAAGKPGTLTHVGLGTFVDPRQSGGKINEVTRQDLVELVTLNQQEFLFYHRIDANVAILRGTTADENGNITMEDECLFLENLAAAQLVTNNGGTVIVQVKNVVQSGQLDPHQVKIPGIFVDVVTIADEKQHLQTFSEAMNPAYCGRGTQQADASGPLPLDAKTIIARRAALELKQGAVVNYGIGIPELIAKVVAAEGQSEGIVATVEPGAIGGTPASGLSFGASAFPQAIITQDQMFDFYDGGGIDQAFLGMAQCDELGDVNVSKFSGKIAGCGGFINISQNAKQVIFCGTFLAGNKQKFVSQVEQITFSAKQASNVNKPVLYITERAVFRLLGNAIELIEIAPGLDLSQDILSNMAFTPVISPELTTMDARVFSNQPMGFTLNEPPRLKQQLA